MSFRTATWYGWVALACLSASACADSGGDELRGRLFVASVATTEGPAVGLSVDFIRTAGPKEAVGTVELSVVAVGATFVGVSLPACLRFSDSGRISLLSETSLPASARVVLTAHRPVDAGGSISTTGAPTGAAGAAGAAGDEPDGNPPCQGAVLDDAVWPTKGAAVVPLPSTTATSTSSSTSTSTTGTGTGTTTSTSTGGTSAGGAPSDMGGMGGAAGDAGAGGETP